MSKGTLFDLRNQLDCELDVLLGVIIGAEKMIAEASSDKTSAALGNALSVQYWRVRKEVDDALSFKFGSIRDS